MLLKAHLISYKDSLQTYVYCPEIDLAESGEMMRDAEYAFYAWYPRYLDHMARTNGLHKFLLTIDWKKSKEGLICPEYSYREAIDDLIQRRLGEHEHLFTPTGILKEILIAIPYEKGENNHYTDHCIPKFNRVLQ